jgi:hypothetical protein
VTTAKAEQRDTTKSDQIVQRFRQRTFKARRKWRCFSGTWETTVEELFPLFCPAREADWILGWDCELIYTDSGYVEENCIFRTDEANPVGEGLWMFTGFEANHYVDFVRFREDIVTRARITVTDNHDGTVTATWDMVSTGLTTKGNEQVDKMPEQDAHFGAFIKMVDYYLKTGRTIDRSSLAVGMVAEGVRGHFASQAH